MRDVCDLSSIPFREYFLWDKLQPSHLIEGYIRDIFKHNLNCILFKVGRVTSEWNVIDESDRWKGYLALFLGFPAISMIPRTCA